jgi:hypothetical protein
MKRSVLSAIAAVVLLGVSGLTWAGPVISWVSPSTGCGGCGPATTAEFFIVGDTGGGPFEGPGLSNLPSGWTPTLVNPNYVVATGPSVNFSGWVEHHLGDIAASVELDVFFWSGAPLVSTIAFAANYTRSSSGNITALHCQSFGSGCAQMNDPTGVNYNRSAVTDVPEPSSLALSVLALAGLAATRRRRV